MKMDVCPGGIYPQVVLREHPGEEEPHIGGPLNMEHDPHRAASQATVPYPQALLRGEVGERHHIIW